MTSPSEASPRAYNPRIGSFGWSLLPKLPEYRADLVRMAVAILVLLAVDRLSKVWVQANMDIGTSIPVIPDLVNFSFYVNRGAVSGFGQHWPFMAPLLAAAGVVFIPAMLFTYRLYTRYHGESFWIRVFFVTGLAAMISTVVDRVQYGYVIDFISVRSLPIFNFADMLPPVGALAIIMELTTKGGSILSAGKRQGSDLPI